MYRSLCLAACLGACLSACLAVSACGSRPPPPPSPYSHNYRTPRDENYHGGPNALLLKYDANHDGAVTRAEMDAGLKAEFEAQHPDASGCLRPDAVAAINAQRIAADQSAATPLQDWNQDGCVDLREYSAAAHSVFDQLDANGDGTVSAQEFKPAGRPGAAGNGPAAGAGGQGRHGRHGGNQPPPP